MRRRDVGLARFHRTERRALAVGAVVLAGVATVSACSSGSGSGSGSSSGSGSTSASKVTITLGGSSPTTDPNSTSLTYFATTVRKLSGGKIVVNPRPDGQLGTAQNLAQSVKSGAVQMATLSPSDMATVDKEVTTLGLPFLVSSQKDVAALYGANGSGDGTVKVIDQQLQSENYTVLGWFQQGFVDVLTKNPVTTLADLKGLKLRAQPDNIQPTLYGSVGAQPTSLDFSEVFTSLQTGTIDGFGDPPSVLYSGKDYQLAKNLVICNILFNSNAFIINKNFFNKLPASEQQDIKTAAASTTKHEWQEDIAAQNSALKAMQAAGLNVTTMSAPDLKTWKSKVSSLYQTFNSQYPGLLKSLGVQS